MRYLIFARKTYEQPLEWIGMLQFDGAQWHGAERAIATPGELGRRAREQFGAEGWLEMAAIPEKSIVHVIPMEGDSVPHRA